MHPWLGRGPIAQSLPDHRQANTPLTRRGDLRSRRSNLSSRQSRRDRQRSHQRSLSTGEYILAEGLVHTRFAKCTTSAVALTSTQAAGRPIHLYAASSEHPRMRLVWDNRTLQCQVPTWNARTQKTDGGGQRQRQSYQGKGKRGKTERCFSHQPQTTAP